MASPPGPSQGRGKKNLRPNLEAIGPLRGPSQKGDLCQKADRHPGRLIEEFMTENERARFQELAQRNELIGQAAQAQANEEVIR